MNSGDMLADFQKRVNEAQVMLRSAIRERNAMNQSHIPFWEMNLRKKQRHLAKVKEFLRQAEKYLRDD